MTATAASHVRSSSGDGGAEDPKELGPRVCEVSVPAVGSVESTGGRAADEKDERGGGEAIQQVLEDVIVEKPLY